MNTNHNTYQNYLENQSFSPYPNNRNLRLNTDYEKTNQKQHYPYYLSTHNRKQQNQSQKINNIPQSAKYKRYKTYQFPSIEQQLETKMERKKTKYPYITIPYNTEEINRNVSKVLTDIEEIESQYRKLSSQNSLSMKNSRQPQLQQNYQQTKIKKNDFLPSLMDKIKKPIKYQQKSDEFIQKQKTQLVNLVKNLNKKLNDQLKKVQIQQHKAFQKQGRRRIKTQAIYQEPRRNQRSPSAMQFQKSLIQVVDQINTNQKLIDNMRNQLQFLNKKYQGYQKSLKNYKSTQLSVDELKNMIRRKKQEISRLRKKKFLTQKSIISIEKKNGSLFVINPKDILSTSCSTSTHSNDVLSSLKEQYSECLKKRDKLQNKLQMNKMHLNRIEQLKEKNNVNREHYEDLLQQMRRLQEIREQQENESQYISRQFTPYSNNRLEKSQSPRSGYKKPYTQSQQQHLQFIYRTKRSKIQLLLNTIRRNDQQLKRKYYKLLKQYESLVQKQQNPSSNTSSQLATFSQSNIYLKNVEIIDGKLDKSRTDIMQLENKIARLGKVGKIIKKVNTNATNGQSNCEDDEQQQSEFYDQHYEVDENDQQPQMKNYDSQNSFKSHTSPFKNNRSLGKNNNRYSDPRIISAGSHIKTPSSEKSIKQNVSSRYRNNQQSSFLSSGEKSFHSKQRQQISFNINSNKNFRSEEDETKNKYIGKFKKQRIVERHSKKQQQAYDRTSQSDQYENEYKRSLPLKDYLRKDNVGDHEQLIKKRNKINVKDTIIEQQIQATNSLESSQHKPSIQLSKHLSRHVDSSSENQNTKKINNLTQNNNNHKWDEKILDLLKDGDENGEQLIEEDIEWVEQVEQSQQNGNYIEEDENQNQREGNGFSPQRESRMLLLRKQQAQKEINQKQIKQKYSNKLYKSRLFN